VAALMSAPAARQRSALQRAYTLNAENLGRRVVRGASYQFLGILLRTVVTIGSTAVLARLLVPADFGFVAMATVITELAALFNNFGFTNLLIQRSRINRLQLDTVFWASTAVGVVLAAVVFGLSFAATGLFGEARVGELLRALCWTFVLAGMPSVAWVVLARRMRFQVEFWLQITVVILRTAVAIGCAWAGLGVWSLVAGALAGAVLQAVLSFVAVPYWPRWRFHAQFLSSRWRTSGSYFGGGLLFYANMNLDLVLIGRWLGATPLGYYQTARSLTDEIRARIAMPLQQVLFPAFSAVQGEQERMQQMVLRSARMIAAIVMPVGFGIAAMAAELVPVLYGDQWLAMTPVLAMFGLSAALRAGTAVAAPLFNATNRVGLSLAFGVGGAALTLGAVALALPHGIEAVAMAIAAVSLYTLLPFRAALGLVGLHGWAWLRVLAPPALASLAMWLSVAALRPLVHGPFESAGARLLVHVALAAAVYAVVLALLSRRSVQDFVELLQRFRADR
jgi:O-antigen/teichoic acid export membrane protein